MSIIVERLNSELVPVLTYPSNGFYDFQQNMSSGKYTYESIEYIREYIEKNKIKIPDSEIIMYSHGDKKFLCVEQLSDKNRADLEKYKDRYFDIFADVGFAGMFRDYFRLFRNIQSLIELETDFGIEVPNRIFSYKFLKLAYDIAPYFDHIGLMISENKISKDDAKNMKDTLVLMIKTESNLYDRIQDNIRSKILYVLIHDTLNYIQLVRVPWKDLPDNTIDNLKNYLIALIGKLYTKYIDKIQQ